MYPTILTELYPTIPTVRVTVLYPTILAVRTTALYPHLTYYVLEFNIQMTFFRPVDKRCELLVSCRSQ